MIFETERTVVRRWTDDDADRVFDILRRDEVVRWLAVGRSISRARKRSRASPLEVSCGMGSRRRQHTRERRPVSTS